jgi:lauroyl/myristoyl acyltransferase
VDWLLPRIDVDPEHEATLRRLKDEGKGAIVATLHGGPKAGVWAHLRRVDVAVLKIQNHDWRKPPANWKIVRAARDAGEGLRLLRRARRHLGQGGWVGTALDDMKSGTRRRTVRCLGRETSLSSGIVSMSLMTGAPIVLLSASWKETGRRIQVEVHEPIHPQDHPSADGDAAEAAIMARLAEQMEGFMKQYPWEVSGNHYRRLLQGPQPGRAGRKPPSTD